MSHKYFKPIKKFVSRKIALEKLKLTNGKFNRLCVISNVYPIIADKKHCYDKEEGWYYYIDDIKKIFYSNAYETLNKNYQNEERRIEFSKNQQFSRASNIKDDEINYVDLVKQKYPSLGMSLEGLGNTVKNLYLAKLLLMDNIDEDLQNFENFVIRKGILNRAFLSKKGAYLSFNCNKIIVCWFVPYLGTKLDEIIEEKSDDIIVKPTVDFEFLDFGSISEESNDEEDKKEADDPNKFDISLLKYALPLLKIHLKLILFKLEKLIPDCTVNGIFSRGKYCVMTQSIKYLIEFVIKAGGGEIVNQDEAEIIITETIETLRDNVKYLQPQYIFDSINESKLVDLNSYLIGKQCPIHKSPFPDVMDIIDPRAVKTLSNKKKYSILDRIEQLD